MIIQTGQRTDIPAFYAPWFAKRLEEGFVCVRNPYNPRAVSRYKLSPEVVDIIGFCTKNPEPMFEYSGLLNPYSQYWFVTITPYGKDVEGGVPVKDKVIASFKKLSGLVGLDSIGWRYDPILITQKYTVEYHIRAFEKIAALLSGFTDTCVISFIDVFPKVKRRFEGIREVSKEERLYLGEKLIKIASLYGMTVRPCAEGDELSVFGADCSGCMTISVYEKAIGKKLRVPEKRENRAECACYLACDIGAYNSCGHLCSYCYANSDRDKVLKNMRLHDPSSPFILGGYRDDDIIHDVVQRSWIDNQPELF